MRHSKTTIATLRKAIRERVGVGHYDDYVPFIRIKKSNSSKISMQGRVRMPGLTRHYHYMSKKERNMSLLLKWLGFDDVREQFPMWPWAHPNPLARHQQTTCARCSLFTSSVKLLDWPSKHVHRTGDRTPSPSRSAPGGVTRIGRVDVGPMNAGP